MDKNGQEYQVQKIRTQYTPDEPTQFDALKRLDKKVKHPAGVFSWLFGTAAALLLGAGMSLIMTDLSQTLGLSDAMLPGLVLGIAGLLMACLNYPIYKALLSRRKRRYAEQVLSLSERILNG